MTEEKNEAPPELKASYDVVIAGAGIIGLAIARRFAQKGKSVLVLEKERTYGLHSSTRNSGVIHAGIYYDKKFLKTRLCVKGKRMLYDYCKSRGVRHRNCTKLIVASSEDQHERLAEIKASGEANGVTDLEWRTGEEAMAMEPGLQCTKAIYSPSTGIVDLQGLLTAVYEDCLAAGVQVEFNSLVNRIEILGDNHFDVELQNGLKTEARNFINSTGLWAQRLAENIDGFDKSLIPPRALGKGRYYTLPGKSPFSRLIYPCPGGASLGVHVTIDVDDNIKFGPNIDWLDGDLDLNSAPDYSLEGGPSLNEVHKAIRGYYPELEDGTVTVSMAGIRPKIQQKGEKMKDWLIQGPKDHNHPGLVNMFGLESPGMTASLAVADHVASLLEEDA